MLKGKPINSRRWLLAWSARHQKRSGQWATHSELCQPHVMPNWNKFKGLFMFFTGVSVLCNSLGTHFFKCILKKGRNTRRTLFFFIHIYYIAILSLYAISAYFHTKEYLQHQFLNICSFLFRSSFLDDQVLYKIS